MVNDKQAPVDKPGTSGNATSEHTTAEHALTAIHRANNGIRAATIAALFIIVALLAVSLYQLKNVTERQGEQAAAQQTEINERAKANRDLLERIKSNSQQTQYLICSVVIASYGPRPVPDQVTAICGPIIANPPAGTTSFLAPGSVRLPSTSQQGQRASITPSVPTNSNSPTPVTPAPTPTPTPVPVVPTNPLLPILQGVPIAGPLLNNATNLVLH